MAIFDSFFSKLFQIHIWPDAWHRIRLFSPCNRSAYYPGHDDHRFRFNICWRKDSSPDHGSKKREKGFYQTEPPVRLYLEEIRIVRGCLSDSYNILAYFRDSANEHCGGTKKTYLLLHVSQRSILVDYLLLCNQAGSGFLFVDVGSHT